ncbi:MAG: response regulator transcription factor [Cellvibrionaceae bacterium]
MTATKLYLVDDDEAVRDGLSLLMKTVGFDVTTFADPQSFLNAFFKLTPGCIIMDIRMPMISGLKVQEKLIELHCDWPVVIISGHGDINACRQAFKHGAVDFLSKPIDEQDLIDAIQKSEHILVQLSNNKAQVTELRSLLSTLTAREREVLDMISLGWSTKEIAAALSLSPRTVESHRAHLADKLGTTSIAEMARLVVEAEKKE